MGRRRIVDDRGERIEEIRYKLMKYFLDQYADHFGPMGNPHEPVDAKQEWKKRIERVVRTGLAPFMEYHGGAIYIFPTIVRELQLPVVNLQDMAELLGWKYIPKMAFKSGNRTYELPVIEVTVDDLINLIVW